MRIIRVVLALTCALAAQGLASAGQMPKYGVTVKASKPAALAKATTYSWTISQPSPIKSVDVQIIAAVDRQLAALGLARATSGLGDLVATYASVRRTDVDLKAKNQKDGSRPQYAVGTLVVDLRDPATKQPLFRVRMDTPITLEPEKAGEAIDAAVTAMFEKYPVRAGNKR